jgi:hypothetical protein
MHGINESPVFIIQNGAFYLQALLEIDQMKGIRGRNHEAVVRLSYGVSRLV